jgi:hypothetical protein
MGHKCYLKENTITILALKNSDFTVKMDYTSPCEISLRLETLGKEENLELSLARGAGAQ